MLENLTLYEDEQSELRLRRAPLPSAGPGQVLVHVQTTGICRPEDTSGATCQGGKPLSRLPAQALYGREAGGVVVSIGPGVHNLALGDRVVIEPAPRKPVSSSDIDSLYGAGSESEASTPSSFCSTLSSASSSCSSSRSSPSPSYSSPGYFLNQEPVLTPPTNPVQHERRRASKTPATVMSEIPVARYQVHASERLHKVPDDFTAAQIAMIEPMTVCLRAAERARVHQGQATLVMGAGALALTMVGVLQAAGASPIVVTDNSLERLDFAQSHFPGITCHRFNEGHTTGMVAAGLAKAFPAGTLPDLVMDCSGNERTMDAACFVCKPSGLVLSVGCKVERAAVPFMHMQSNQIDSACVARYRHTWPLAIRLTETGMVDLRGLVTHIYPLDQAEMAIRVSDTKTPGQSLPLEHKPTFLPYIFPPFFSLFSSLLPIRHDLVSRYFSPTTERICFFSCCSSSAFSRSSHLPNKGNEGLFFPSFIPAIPPPWLPVVASCSFSMLYFTVYWKTNLISVHPMQFVRKDKVAVLADKDQTKVARSW